MDIAKAEAEIAALQYEVDKEKARLSAMSDVQKQAEELHAVTCRHNHIDACGWEYEQWPRKDKGESYMPNSTKKSYVDKVMKIKGHMHGHYGGSFEDAVEIYKVVRGY